MKTTQALALCASMLASYAAAHELPKALPEMERTAASTITITAVQPEHKRKPPTTIEGVTFGTIFTNHMFVMEWTSKNGWHNARIESYKPFSFDPASLHMHYGSEIFEGLKAHRTEQGNILLFRPRDHLHRMNQSAKRMCMPEIDVDFVLQALKLLIKQDQEWVPDTQGASLYIRPTMIATESTINLKISEKYLFFILLSPVYALYKDGFKPIPILVSERYTRSSIGGVGQAKTGGNYAASMLAQKEAKEQGCAQVLWLDPVERTYIEEVGSMNIFFVINNELITPELTGTILPGITRKSVLELAQKAGLTVIEKRISLEEVLEAIEAGACTEIFGTGTAAVISPIGSLRYKNKDYIVNGGKTGKITQDIFTQLTSVHRGIAPDLYGWTENITPKAVQNLETSTIL